jgi:hypothetical protein
MSFLDEVVRLPVRLLSLVSVGGLVVIGLGVALLTLFIVHQVSLWLSLDPENAFHNAKSLVTIYASAYDTTSNLWNAFAEVALVGIPAWNAAAEYVVQPLIFTSLDVLSIAFTQKPYSGVITEEDVPYHGFVCPRDGSMDKSSEFCGKLSFYSTQLGVSVGGSNFVGNSSVTLSTKNARRLSEVTGDPIVGVLDLGVLADAIQSLLGSFVVLTGTLADIVFHVVWTTLSEGFETLFNLFIVAVKSISSAAMMVVRSGVLSTVLSIGFDLLVVMFTDILLPYLFAVINAIMCLIDYTQVAGWSDQLDCVERTCFKESSDTFGEVFHTFSSVPPIAIAIQGVVTKLANRNTGQRYGSSSSGGVDVPEIDAGSPETPRTHICGECFNCKAISTRLKPT